MSVQQRRRASPMGVSAALMHPQPAEDEAEDVRGERERRAGLYGRAEPRKLPAVDLPPRDARTRKDLQLLLRRQEDRERGGGNNNNTGVESRFEREQQDAAKHRESAGWRPPMDRASDLRGLRTTVPKDLRQSADQQAGNQRGHTVDWALGSGGRNAASSGAAARSGVDGVFQPPEGAALVYAQTRHRLALPSAMLAYPPRSPARASPVFNTLQEAEPHEPEREAKPAWCPASYATLGNVCDQQHEHPPQTPVTTDAASPSRRQRFPLRTSLSTPALAASQQATPQEEERCATRQQALMTKVVDAYAKLRRRVDKHKQPAARYALPIENEQRHPRAYRLGLDSVPSSSSSSLQLDERHERDPNASPTVQSTRPKLEFRPKSAGCLAGFQPSSTSANSSLKSGAAKVAGAKRRPRSASITYLGRATVYCMAPESPRNPSGGGFGGELADERRRRRQNRERVRAELSKRGVFHGLALAQIFSRLRREALGGAAASTRRRRAPTSPPSSSSSPSSSPTPGVSKAEMKRAAALEQLSLDEFLDSCALTLESEADGGSDASPSIEAARESLAVSRAQFLAALEPFHHAVAVRDANAVFSVVDADVCDRARVCELVLAISSLQRGHERLRRARVQL